MTQKKEVFFYWIGSPSSNCPTISYKSDFNVQFSPQLMWGLSDFLCLEVKSNWSTLTKHKNGKHNCSMAVATKCCGQNEAFVFWQPYVVLVRG